MPTYPTWVRKEPGRWESEEQVDGTPDFIAVRTQDRGWWVKWRTSAQPISGFSTFTDVKDSVARSLMEGERIRARVEKHDYEPDMEDDRYRGDPNCRICGRAKHSPNHFGEGGRG